MTKLPVLTLTALCALLLSNPAHAANCTDLHSCAKVMFDITGQRYVWEKDAGKKLEMVPDVELTKENAEMVFTALLDQVHLARIPVGDGKTYRVVTGAEAKEIELPILEANAEHKPTFPKTWDWVTMRYRPKARELTDSIESAYRLHVPRESRLQADFSAGLIIVTGSTPVVRQMYETIKAADVVNSPEVKKQIEARRREWLEQIKASNKK